MCDIASNQNSNRQSPDMGDHHFLRSNSSNSKTSYLIQFSPSISSQPVFAEFSQSQGRLNYAEILQDANANDVKQSKILKVNPSCYTAIDLARTEAFAEVKRKRSEDMTVKCLADLDNSPIVVLKS